MKNEEKRLSDAMIVTKDHKYYPMTRFEANWYLINNNIENFHCATVRGITYFYIEG